MLNKKALGAFDWFRMIAAALVVAIHAPPITVLGDNGNLFLTGVTARIAVPFFFAVTGFFTDFTNAEKVKKLILKTCIIYAVSIAVYLPYGTYQANIKQILFDGAFYHLWYFPALALGAAIVYILRKLPTPSALAIAAALYIFGLFGDSYHTLIERAEPLCKVFDALSKIFSYTRNGIFLAPLFLLVGNILGSRSSERKSTFMSVMITAQCLILSLVMLTIERFSLREITFSPHDNMFVCLVPCTIFLIMLLSLIKAKPRPILRKISMWIYIIHPIFIDLIRRITRGFDKESAAIDADAEKAIITTISSVIIAVSLEIIMSTIAKRKKINHHQDSNLLV